MSDKPTPQHHDYFGRPLAVNDCVVFSVRNLFQVGRVTKLAEKKIRIIGYDNANCNWRTNEAKGNVKYGHEVLKVDEQEVTMYLLRKPNR
jgi:hypothetical protein